MSEYFIYALVDPRNLLVRYVGSSRRGMKRPKQHAYPSVLNSKHTHTSNWIKTLINNNLMYSIVVLETTPRDVNALYEAERWWIAYGRALGWDLTNHTIGGEGQNGWIPNTETRTRISAALTGRKASPETKLKQSNAHKGKVFSLETRAKLSESRRGYKHSPEARALMSLKAKQRIIKGCL